MAKAYVFFADGFEEVEALTTVDLLRRGGVATTTVSVKSEPYVTGAHGVTIRTDALFDEIDRDDADLYVLPGGQPGTNNLEQHDGLRALLIRANEDPSKKIAAICAAPLVFGHLGFLKGKRATCYPGVEGELFGAETLTDEVVIDGDIVTSRGVGTAIPFGLALIGELVSAETAAKVAESIVFRG